MTETFTIVSETEAAQVITLAEAKRHLRITIDAEDERTYHELDAAISHAAAFMRRPVRRAQYRHARQGWQRIGGHLGVRLQGLISSVDSIEYKDSDGNLQTIAASVYDTLIGTHATVIREAPNQSWPELAEYLENIRVTFTAGYSHATVPYGVRLGIMLILTWLHDGDEKAERAAYDLLRPWALPPW